MKAIFTTSDRAEAVDVFLAAASAGAPCKIMRECFVSSYVGSPDFEESFLFHIVTR